MPAHMLAMFLATTCPAGWTPAQPPSVALYQAPAAGQSQPAVMIQAPLYLTYGALWCEKQDDKP